MICAGSVAHIACVLGAAPGLGANPTSVGSSEDGHSEEKSSCPTLVWTDARVGAHEDLY